MHLLLPVLFSIAACYTDLKTRKIKNYITYPLIFLGVFINTFLNGLKGFAMSITGILSIVILISIISITKLGGGDLKLAMGYGTFLTSKNHIMFIFFFLLFVLIGNIFLLIREKGFKNFISELKLEIKTLGFYKTSFNKVPGAPFLLGAYILTILFS